MGTERAAFAPGRRARRTAVADSACGGPAFFRLHDVYRRGTGSCSIPSNWRELPGSNAVTFAPDGAYGNVGIKSVFTHGVGMGLARNDKRNLRITTDDFIAWYVLAAPSPGRTFQYRRVTLGDRPGLHTVLSSVSEATGEPEHIEVFTTLLRDGTLFYVLAVAPRDCVSDYESAFGRIVGSIEIMD